MKRISTKDLELLVERLNRITKSPLHTWTKSEGKLTASIGNYHLESAYGGWRLCRIVSVGGSTQDVLCTGYTTKRKLYDLISAYIGGIEY